MKSWNVKDLHEKGYRQGSILRVHMVNFLTYDNCEVFPGPKLNIVLGPNGTGKSTMTHAICLACGGSPLAIGRAPELNKFVKNDKQDQECFIEVDLLSSKNSVQTIRRVINSVNKSSFWYLNGEKTKESTIKELMIEESINMNNLCSFMPQDRVGKFTRLTPKEVLQETLKCISKDGVGGKSLYDIQQELASYEENKLSAQESKIRKQSVILQLETQLAQLKGDVDRMNQRQELTKQLEVARLAEKLFTIQEIQNDREINQASLDTLTTRLAQENERITPLETKERDLKRQQQQFDRVVDTAKTAYRNTDHSLKNYRDSSEKIDIEIEDLSNELQIIAHRRAEQEAKLRIAREEVLQKEVDLTEAEQALPKIDAKLQQINSSLQLNMERERELTDEREDIHNQIINQSSIITNLTQELNGLKDQSQIFRKLLETKIYNGRKIIEFMDFIELSKSRLQGEVFGPIGCHLRITDPACAAMVEHVLPYKTLTATFLATTEADGELLKKHIYGKNSGVTVISLVNVEFPHRNHNTDPNHYRHLGLQGYLLDKIQCPDIVRGYLQMFHGLQNVLWSRIDLSQTKLHGPDITELSLHKLYVDNVTPSPRQMNASSSSSSTSASNHQNRPGLLDITSYNGTRSKYGEQKVSVSTNRVHPQYILTSGNGEEDDDDTETRKMELDSRLRDAKNKKLELERLIGAKSKEMDTIRDQGQQWKDQKVKLNKAKKLPMEMALRLESSMRKVHDLERQLASNVEDEKRKILRAYQEKIATFQEVCESIIILSQTALDSQIKLMITEDFKVNLSGQIRDARNAIDEAKQGLVELNHSIARIKDHIKTIDIQMRSLEMEVKEQERLLGEESFNQLIMEVAKLEVITLIEVQERIEYLQLQLGRNVNNPAVIERYNQLKIQYEREKEEYTAIENEFLGLEEGLRQKSSDWFDSVENVRRKLNESFGLYMQELKFKGEVELVKQGKINDYEMQMKVAFRDDAIVTNLSGFRHSGGERNVSTMMYLMALQDMTTAPFRIVDEINQGMDERNERLVYDRIVRNCCGNKRSPQYFLITPKLLEALQSLNHDDITVLVVFNGPGATVDWNIPKFIHILIQQYRHMLTASDVEDDVEGEDMNVNMNEMVVHPVSKKRGILPDHHRHHYDIDNDSDSDSDDNKYHVTSEYSCSIEDSKRIRIN